MRTPTRLLLAATLFGGLLVPTLASAALRTGAKPKIAFLATGSPGFLDIEGDSSTLQTADDGTTLTFTVPMSTVKTGIDLRDSHMNEEYVDVAHFPNAVMTLARADVKWPANSGEKSTGTAHGTFTVHGQAQPVDVPYTISRTSTGYKVSASFKFDASRSGITIPSYLGVTVDPKMHAEVTTELLDS